ncbi:MAG: NTP transferase domain-containing protein [Gemmatimonadota bacterium]|nr:MAG: NTP transferase domain-containing protein [Gemmatimonadota bacterium]
MILAAGAGTRLRPLTDTMPKALVPVGDRPLLGWVLQRLAESGVDRIIVNTHYHEDQIVEYLDSHTPANIDLAISPEPDGPYDTGGGLFAASHLFRENRPFLLHNVDVLSRIPFEGLLDEHARARQQIGDRVVATVAVQARDADRQLLFDDLGLMGWENAGSDRTRGRWHRVREPVGTLRRYSFTGIHVIDPSLFQATERAGKFSIITLYLELAAFGYVVVPSDVSEHDWIDAGTPDRLVEAGRMMREQ